MSFLVIAPTVNSTPIYNTPHFPHSHNWISARFPQVGFYKTKKWKVCLQYITHIYINKTFKRGQKCQIQHCCRNGSLGLKPNNNKKIPVDRPCPLHFWTYSFFVICYFVKHPRKNKICTHVRRKLCSEVSAPLQKNSPVGWGDWWLLTQQAKWPYCPDANWTLT